MLLNFGNKDWLKIDRSIDVLIFTLEKDDLMFVLLGKKHIFIIITLFKQHDYKVAHD